MSFQQSLKQWIVDFQILSSDRSKQNASVHALLSTVQPTVLLQQLNKSNDDDLTSVLLFVIRSTFSTSAGKELWASSLDILPLLVHGCHSDSTDVTSACAQLLLSSVTTQPVLSPQSALFQSVVNLLASVDLEVSSCASSILLHMCTRLSEETQQQQLVSAVANLWQNLNTTNTTAAYRCLDVLARVAHKSTAYFDLVRNTGCWTQLDEFLNSNVADVLLQMSIFEMLEGFVEKSVAACNAIASEEVYNTLLDVAGVPEDDIQGEEEEEKEEEDPIIRNGALRVLTAMFCATASHATSATMLMLHKFIQTLENVVDPVTRSSDSSSTRTTNPTTTTTTTTASLVTVLQSMRRLTAASQSNADLVMSSPRLTQCVIQCCLALDDSQRALGFHAAADLIRGAAATVNGSGSSAMALNSDSKMHVSNTATELTQTQVVDHAEGQRAQRAEAFYCRLGETWEQNIGIRKDTTDVLLTYVREPLPHTRYAAYDLMAAVAGAPSGWGLRTLFSKSDFVDYIFDRHTETEKEGKEWKFAVLSATYRSAPLNVLLGPSVVERLEKFLKDGPFYAETAAPTVALGTA